VRAPWVDRDRRSLQLVQRPAGGTRLGWSRVHLALTGSLIGLGAVVTATVAFGQDFTSRGDLWSLLPAWVGSTLGAAYCPHGTNWRRVDSRGADFVGVFLIAFGLGAVGRVVLGQDITSLGELFSPALTASAVSAALVFALFRPRRGTS
jgi:hypothetical protein